MQDTSVKTASSDAGDSTKDANQLAYNNRDTSGAAVAANTDQEMCDLEEEPVYEPVNGMVQPPFKPSEDRPIRLTNQLQFLNQKVFNAVYKHRFARPFRSPVNAIKLELPDYHTIIKHPMDLGTIKKRLDNYWYYSAKECIRDFKRMFDNCYKYNNPEDDVVDMAKTLEEVFNNQIAEMNPTEVEIPMPQAKGGRGRGSAGKATRGRGTKRSLDVSEDQSIEQANDSVNEQSFEASNEPTAEPVTDATMEPVLEPENKTAPEPTIAATKETAIEPSKTVPNDSSRQSDEAQKVEPPNDLPSTPVKSPEKVTVSQSPPQTPSKESSQSSSISTPNQKTNSIPQPSEPSSEVLSELPSGVPSVQSSETVSESKGPTPSKEEANKITSPIPSPNKSAGSSSSQDFKQTPEQVQAPPLPSKPETDATPVSPEKETNSTSLPSEHSGNKTELTPTPPAPPPERKRRWGSSTGSTSGLLKEPIGISSNALKVLIPDLNKSHLQVSKATDESNQEAKEPCTFVSGDGNERPKSSTQLIVTGKITVEPSKDPQKEPSPARNPPSNILFIKNLVRPFTLTQLKDLLNKTGKLVEEKFWIDKIKSKCYVLYETQEQAEATREALHGTRWPDANPKRLIVDFSNEEELSYYLNFDEKSRPPVGETKTESVDESTKGLKNSEQLSHEKYDAAIRRGRIDDGDKISNQPKSEEKSESGEKRHSEKQLIREWDREKLESKHKDGNRSPSPPSKRLRTSSPGSESKNRSHKDHSKDTEHRNLEDIREKDKNSLPKDKSIIKKETPVKLLEDLFMKTKTKPCIYWLPLDEQQACKREELRKQNARRRDSRRPYWSAW